MAIFKKALFTICILLCNFNILSATQNNTNNDTYISPNHYKSGTQSERIQKAINDAKKTTGKVVIPRYDVVKKTNVWLIDQAILLPGDFELELNNCQIKLSDKCRDNFIRSANAGLGIKEVAPLKNIKVIGVGNVLLEGANNPRSTGDHNKTLALNPASFGYSFGFYRLMAYDISYQ